MAYVKLTQVHLSCENSNCCP